MDSEDDKEAGYARDFVERYIEKAREQLENNKQQLNLLKNSIPAFEKFNTEFENEIGELENLAQLGFRGPKE